METMLNVTVNGTIHQYPYGTTYRAIAAEFHHIRRLSLIHI